VLDVDDDKDGILAVFTENFIDFNIMRLESGSSAVPSNNLLLSVDLSMRDRKPNHSMINERE
jgi:hypothetical protein